METVAPPENMKNTNSLILLHEYDEKMQTNKHVRNRLQAATASCERLKYVGH